MYRYDGTSTWYEIENVKDVTLNLEGATADVTTRGGNGWRQSVKTLKDGNVSWQMVYDTADADFTAIKDAFLNNDDIKLEILDGDRTTTGTQGLQADFSITGFNINESLEEAMTVDVTAVTAYSSTAPSWETIS
tara:strand:+ start:2362 stop:2763 length:402 start_codon:yes stop_codon:yes gene_type:complete